MSSNLKNQPSADDQETRSNGRGMLIVVSSPSGGGKGTLIRKVLETVSEVGYSVSYTTRTPREGEVNGRHYFFIAVDEFRRMQAAGEFLESAEVHGNLYATSHARVKAELSEGRDIILEIDVQGADNVRKLVHDAVMIFVLPPSFEILSERLTARGSEKPEELSLRLQNARQEVDAYRKFDFVIINDDATRAANQLASIVYAERARRERQDTAASRVLNTFTQATIS